MYSECIVKKDKVVATFQRAISGDFQKTYIAQLEVLAGVALYYTYPERIRGRQVNHFIDNTVALSGLSWMYPACIGSPSQIHVSRMYPACILHLRYVPLRIHMTI